MDPQLTPADSVDAVQALAAWIEAQRAVLERHAAVEAKRLDPKAIHELRVALRRLLSALALSEALGVEQNRKTRRRLRKLLSALSPARDAHVQLRLLAELCPEPSESAPLLAELRRKRRAAAKRARERLRRFVDAEHDRDLPAIVSALRASSAARDVTDAALLGALAKRYLIVERRLQQAASEDPEFVHELRVAIKDYRYALEALAPALPAVAAAVRRCEALQGLLGGAHDTHVLSRSAAGLARGPDGTGLGSLAEELRRLSQRQHASAAVTLSETRLSWLTSDE